MQHSGEFHAGEKAHANRYGHYLLIWLGLLALTGITVALAGINLGRWLVLTSLTIAAIKSTLVLNIFMHLRSEERVFRIFVGVAILTLSIFIVLTFFDYAFY